MRKPLRGKPLLVVDRRAGKVSHRRTSYVTQGYYNGRIVLLAAIVVAIAIVIMLAVWGVTSVLADILKPDVIDETTESNLPGVGREASGYNDDDAMTVMFIKTSDDGKQPEYVMLTRFEPSEERVYVSSVSEKLRLGERTLEDWFTEYGAEQCAEKMAHYIDCGKVYTVLFTYTQTRLLINEFGGVNVTVPYPIKYTSPGNDRNINVAAGTRLFTGGEVARLLNYPDWENGEAEHRKMYSDILGQLISDRLKPGSEDKLKNNYLKLYSGTTCDIPRSDFQKKSSGLAYLAGSNNGDLIMPIELNEIENGDGTISLSDDDKGYMLLQAVFGRRN